MKASTAGSKSPATGRYYRSFVSYEVPFRPDGPLDYADTEGMRSFYIASHDDQGRVARFDKMLLVREPGEPQVIELPVRAEPQAQVYFATRHDPGTQQPGVGEPISYSETELLTEFYAGYLDASGKSATARLYRKSLEFSEEYEYWPNGKLSKRIQSGREQPRVTTRYDENGNIIPEQIPIAPLEEERGVETFDLFLRGTGANVAARQLKAELETAVPGVVAREYIGNVPWDVGPLHVSTPPAALEHVAKLIASWFVTRHLLTEALWGYHGWWRPIPTQPDEAAAILRELFSGVVQSRGEGGSDPRPGVIQHLGTQLTDSSGQ